MAANLTIPAILLFLSSGPAVPQSIRPTQDFPKFTGREVTITAPQHDPDDPDGFFPLAPASVCIEGPPQRQC